MSGPGRFHWAPPTARHRPATPPAGQRRSRLRPFPWTPRPPTLGPVIVGLWVATAAATVAVVAALLLAVPCGVYAVVGLCFNDPSTPWAASVAALSGSVAAAAAVPAFAGLRRLGRPAYRAAEWN